MPESLGVLEKEVRRLRYYPGNGIRDCEVWVEGRCWSHDGSVGFVDVSLSAVMGLEVWRGRDSIAASCWL